MKQGIVIVTWSGGMPQLELLLQSLRGYHKYPVYILMNDVRKAPMGYLLDLTNRYHVLASVEDTFECGAIKGALELTDLDEFIVLQDTIEVKQPIIFEQIFDNPNPVTFGPKFFHFLGKFRRKTLEKVQIPETLSKFDAIQAELQTFLPYYIEAEGPDLKTLFPDFSDDNPANKIEYRWGRANMVLENKYLIKRKGNWSET